MHKRIRLFGRLAAAALGAAGMLGHAHEAPAVTASSVSQQQAALADRIERARERLVGSAPQDTSPPQATRLAQWFNWPNWGNYWRNGW